MSTSALFIIAPNWTQPRHLSLRTAKQWCSHRNGILVSNKKGLLLIHIHDMHSSRKHCTELSGITFCGGKQLPWWGEVHRRNDWGLLPMTEPCEWTILGVGLPVPFKPLYNFSPDQHPTWNLMRPRVTQLTCSESPDPQKLWYNMC